MYDLNCMVQFVISVNMLRKLFKKIFILLETFTGLYVKLLTVRNFLKKTLPVALFKSHLYTVISFTIKMKNGLVLCTGT